MTGFHRYIIFCEEIPNSFFNLIELSLIVFSVISWREGGGGGGCHFEMQCLAFTATLHEVTIMQDYKL